MEGITARRPETGVQNIPGGFLPVAVRHPHDALPQQVEFGGAVHQGHLDAARIAGVVVHDAVAGRLQGTASAEVVHCLPVFHLAQGHQFGRFQAPDAGEHLAQVE
jgi:hypothetical protein